jgi:hypothetical protein
LALGVNDIAQPPIVRTELKLIAVTGEAQKFRGFDLTMEVPEPSAGLRLVLGWASASC